MGRYAGCVPWSDGAISWLLKLPLVGYDLRLCSLEGQQLLLDCAVRQGLMLYSLTGCGPGRTPYSGRAANMASQLNGATGCAPSLNRFALGSVRALAILLCWMRPLARLSD